LALLPPIEEPTDGLPSSRQDVERGEFAYQCVLADGGVAIRETPSLDSKLTGFGVNAGDTVLVSARVFPPPDGGLSSKGTTFLRLADGGGWVFDQVCPLFPLKSSVSATSD
jgi:hypothetical protein